MVHFATSTCQSDVLFCECDCHISSLLLQCCVLATKVPLHSTNNKTLTSGMIGHGRFATSSLQCDVYRRFPTLKISLRGNIVFLCSLLFKVLWFLNSFFARDCSASRRKYNFISSHSRLNRRTTFFLSYTCTYIFLIKRLLKILTFLILDSKIKDLKIMATLIMILFKQACCTQKLLLINYSLI